VEWHPRNDGHTASEADRNDTLSRLAGTTVIADRSRFLHLLRLGYADESQGTAASGGEPIQKQLIRAICAAIVRSRTLKQTE
jgi:hypothetical protein